MDGIKRILLCTITAVLAVYLLLYFALPYILNKNNYSQALTQNIKKQTGLLLYIHNYKIKVSPLLDIQIKADEIQLFYPNKKQIIDVKNADINISTIYLIKKEIRLSTMKAKELQFTTKLLKNGKTTFQEYLEKNAQTHENGFYFSKNYPNIDIKNYTIKIKDEKSGQKFKIKGNNLKTKQSLDFKNINIETNGEVYCFKKKYLDFSTKLSIPTVLLESVNKTTLEIKFDDLYKYDFYANLNTDLKIHEKNKKFSYLSGKADINNFKIKLGSQELPQSYFHFIFEKDFAKLISKFYTNKNESADINALIKLAKPYEIDLKCICSKADIANLHKTIIPVLNMLKIKNNLSELSATGTLSANFSLRTNLKTVHSNGSLKILNGAISHKNIPLKINGINALIDFSDNAINIKKSNILVNSQPLNLHGNIDKNAQANIFISAENLALNHIINAFPFLKPQKNIIIQSGNVSFKTSIKGSLANISPQTNATITNFSIKELNNDVKISTKLINITATINQNKYTGLIAIKNVLFQTKQLHNQLNALKADEISLKFDDKDLTIQPAKINAGNAKLTIDGIIKNYKKQPNANITVQGSVDTKLLTAFAPKDITFFAKGYLPIKANINSDLKNTIFNIKLLANPENYITPFLIKSFEKTNTLTTIKGKYSNNTVSIDDASMYFAENINSLLKEINTYKLKKAISIHGVITDLTQTPKFKELHIKIPNDLKLAIPNTNDGTAQINADIKLSGNLSTPILIGNINISEFRIPSYFISSPDIRIIVNQNNLSIQINSLKIRDMLLSLLVQSSTNLLTSTSQINYIKLNANYIDLDYLMTLSTLLPQAKFAPGSDFPYTINGGDLNIKSIKIGKLILHNTKAQLSSVKNILYIKKLTSDAYSGKIAANITYNFPYTSTKAEIQGRNLDAGVATSAILPKEQNISGKLDFDASINTIGTTQNQQMKNLKGRADVLIKNGKLGQLGRFEHFLYAQNLLSQRLIYANINSAKQAIRPQNTGYIAYFKGMLKFSGGYVHINPALTSGDKMSMYITGHANLLRNDVDLKILGKISSEVSSSLGLLGTMTLKDFLDSHTKYGATIANLFNSYNTELPEIDITKIPPLTPDYKYQTKNFLVIISGDPNSVKAVKSFTWVNPIGTKEKALIQKAKDAANTTLPTNKVNTYSVNPAETTQHTQQQPTQTKTTPDFLDNIPNNFN